MSNFFVTTDINLVAFLISKGFFVESTQQNGRLVEFYFDEEVEKEGQAWQFNPDSEMRLVQRFIAEKEKLLSFLKTKQSRSSNHEKHE